MISTIAIAIRDHATMVNSNRLSKREEVWIRAYCACASSSNVELDIVPLSWADTCLKAFDLRFAAPAPEGNPAQKGPTP